MAAPAEDVIRALHWVFKIGNLEKSMEFYSKVFGLRVLRHEEFSEGCAATCNGPYGGAWSKTMIGYGPETENFALELTYNYGINSYERGNDLRYIALKANDDAGEWSVFGKNRMKKTAKELGYEVEESKDGDIVTGPDGCRYKLVNSGDRKEPFVFVSINVENLASAREYWEFLGMKAFEGVPGAVGGDKSVMLGYKDEQVKLELVELPAGEKLDHKLASGRMAFATRNGPTPIYERIKAKDLFGGGCMNTPITLETPGKADVVVTILSDRDGYEICYVNEDGFDDLCTTKPGDDFIHWEERFARGSDGREPPKVDYSGVESKGVMDAEDDEEFDAKLAEGGLVVADFWGTWCKKCRAVFPKVAELSEVHPTVQFIKVDVGELEDTAADAGVSAVPHFIFYKDGEKKGDFVGSDPEALAKAVGEFVDANK